MENQTGKDNKQNFYNSEIPADWEISSFEEVFSFLSTFSFSREQLTDEKTADEVLYIHYGDIHAKFGNEILDFETELRIPFLKDGFLKKEEMEDAKFPFLKDGDLIIADASEDYDGVCECVELKNVNGRKVIGGLHTFAARDENNKTALGFRTYFFKNRRVVRELMRIATGISVYGVSKTNLSKVKLALPPLAEQRKIAAILSTCDIAIENCEKLITVKFSNKRALMQQLLTGRKRFLGFEKRDWVEVRLSDVFDRVTRKNNEGNTNVVTISARRGFVRQNEFFNKFVASETLDNYFLVQKGEFCYNKSYSNGYPWGATKRLKEFEKAVVTTLYICFKLRNETNHSEEFFEHFFEFGSLERGLTKIAHEGGRAHGLLNVTPSDFFTLKITIPPTIEEQKRIAAVLNACDAEINLLTKKLEALKNQKRGLMQQLLTGKIRVNVGEAGLKNNGTPAVGVN